MGYSASQVDSELHIAAQDEPAAVAAVKAWACRMVQQNTGLVNCHEAETVAQAETIQDILEVWDYTPEFDQAGDVADVHWCEPDNFGRVWHQQDLWNVLAPYVRPGSYLEMCGDATRGERWRWKFDGQTCQEILPTLVWE